MYMLKMLAKLTKKIKQTTQPKLKNNKPKPNNTKL